MGVERVKNRHELNHECHWELHPFYLGKERGEGDGVYGKGRPEGMFINNNKGGIIELWMTGTRRSVHYYSLILLLLLFLRIIAA